MPLSVMPPELELPNLVEPAFLSYPEYAYSIGEEVADLGASVGMIADDEQRLVLELAFALTLEDKHAAFETAVICARQNMKTGVMKVAALADLFLMKKKLVVWSAHEFPTSAEAFRDMITMIEENPELARKVLRYARGSGREGIELRDGRRMIFRARTNDGGRGLTGDAVYLDEAFALTPAHMGAILPALSARPDPRVVYGSSAGKMGSAQLRTVRDRGREHRPGRLAYTEWCAPKAACQDPNCEHLAGISEGCQLDVVSNWIVANPLLGRVRANGTGISIETIENERSTLNPREFARERLGWWDDAGGVSVFEATKWNAGLRAARPLDLKVQALAVATSFDMRFSTIAAGAFDSEGNAWGKVLRHGPGTGWVLEYVGALQDTFGVPVVTDSRGPAAALIPLMEQQGVTLHVATTADALDAFSRWETHVNDGSFRYEEQDELNEAVRLASTRPVGDRTALARKEAGADISPAEAVMFASWFAESGPKPTRSAYEDGDLMVV